MKKIYISGENGFIAKNLISRIKQRNIDLHIVNFNSHNLILNEKNEIDFVNNTLENLEKFILENKVDFIVHNGAIVGTDVVALNPKEAILSNVYGTYNLSLLSKKLNIPIIYLGTTVIYDTKLYQNISINEKSIINPRTLYASTKYEGEIIIKNNCKKSKYCILRPLFCYGGYGDMNSLIAKSIFNWYSKRGKPYKIFLDKNKMKDYMHVFDFVDGIISVITSNNINNDEYNLSSQMPLITSDILKKIEQKIGFNDEYISWVPETDYLGNHIIDSSKFINDYNWNPKITLDDGILLFYNELKKMYNENNNYNPLKYIDIIDNKKIKIEEHYNNE